MNPARGAAAKKRRTLLAVTLFIFLLLCAAFVVLFTFDRQSSSPPRIVFRSVSDAGDGTRHATFEIINTSKSPISRFGYVRIEGPAIVRHIINLPPPPTTRISPRGKEILDLPLPTNAVGDLNIRFFGSRPSTALQQTAEIAGELLEKLNLQPARLKAFYDHSANTWEIDSSFSIPAKP